MTAVSHCQVDDIRPSEWAGGSRKEAAGPSPRGAGHCVTHPRCHPGAALLGVDGRHFMFRGFAVAPSAATQHGNHDARRYIVGQVLSFALPPFGRCRRWSSRTYRQSRTWRVLCSFFLSAKLSAYLGPSPAIEPVPTTLQPAAGSMISRVLHADGFVVVEQYVHSPEACLHIPDDATPGP